MKIVLIKTSLKLVPKVPIRSNPASGWETNARPLANASENLAGRVENRPGQVEFCIDYIRDCPVRASAKIF